MYKTASVKLQCYQHYVYHKADKLQAKVLVASCAVPEYKHLRLSCAIQGWSVLRVDVYHARRCIVLDHYRARFTL